MTVDSTVWILLKRERDNKNKFLTCRSEFLIYKNEIWNFSNGDEFAQFDLVVSTSNLKARLLRQQKPFGGWPSDYALSLPDITWRDSLSTLSASKVFSSCAECICNIIEGSIQLRPVSAISLHAVTNVMGSLRMSVNNCKYKTDQMRVILGAVFGETVCFTPKCCTEKANF